jgi:hypothetical protein
VIVTFIFIYKLSNKYYSEGEDMGCEWLWRDSFDEEMREKERRYREKIRRKLEKYNSMIDKAKVKEQIRADVLKVLKEAMNQEIPDHKLSNRVRSAVWKYFGVFEEKWIFDDIFIHYHYDERSNMAIKKLDEGAATVVRGTYKDRVEVEARITLEILADSGFGASTLMDEDISERVKLAEVVLEYTADIRKQDNKYLVKVLHLYDVDVIVY